MTPLNVTDDPVCEEANLPLTLSFFLAHLCTPQT